MLFVLNTNLNLELILGKQKQNILDNSDIRQLPDILKEIEWFENSEKNKLCSRFSK